jgi:hypothetical protein
MWAQQVAPPATTEPAKPATVPPAAVTTVASSTQEDVVKLSPFEVKTSGKDIGYYAENTLAGSRLNTNVGDLASSITVVTKQQLIDTASVDINDVFMYEANTEGSRTYTPSPFIAASNRLTDAISGFGADNGSSGYGPATSNRIRGLDVSDAAVNNYPASARIPFDGYNTNSVEINRGPNSLLFGTGSPAGITNQSTTSAILGKQKSELSYQLSSWGGYRGTVGHNQPIGDKLAIYVAALYDEKGFERKPSYDLYRRQYGALTFTPFKSTKITANFENFNEHNRRPNYITPRDGVTPWINNGRPVWNPTTQMITVLDTGAVYGPYLTDTRDARYTATIAAYPSLSQSVVAANRITIGNTWLSTLTSVLYVPGIQFRSTHNYMLFNQGNLLSAWQGSPSSTAQPTFPTGIPATSAGSPVVLRTQQDWVLAANRPSLSAFAQAPMLPNGTVLPNGALVSPTNQVAKYATWYAPGVSNKAIYDWDSINAVQMNYGQTKAKTYNVEFQQEITSNLHLDVGWFRQEIDQWDSYAAGEANQQFSLYTDTNQLMPDGTANPFLGSPVEFDYSQDLFQRPETDNNWRVMLAYQKDFTQDKGWTRWLGSHTLMGLWSQSQQVVKNLRYRLSIDGGDTRYLPNNVSVANSGVNYALNGSLFDRFFYLGQNQRGVVQYASGGGGDQPGFGGIGAANFNTYNFLTHSENQAAVTFDPNYTDAGTTPLAQKVLESQSLAYQGYFWKNRIVATLGWRRDDFRSRQTDLTGTINSDKIVNGYEVPSIINRVNNWAYLRGRTKTAGVVARPFVWSSGSLGGHLNTSDNFNAPTSIQYDYFGNRLGKPQGKGKDYGFDLSLFDNKLVARINWFKSNNQTAVAIAAATAAGRVTLSDTTNMRGWAEWVVRYRNGEDTTAYFGNNTVHPLTATEITQIQTLMGDPNYSYANNSWPTGWRASTQENRATGLEGQLIYNPLRNWNIKLTVGKQRSVYDNVAPQLFAWLAYRLPVWKNITVNDAALQNEILVTTAASGTGTTPTLLSNFWHGYGFSANAKLSNASGLTPTWTSPEGYYNSTVLSDLAVMTGLQGQTVPNERQWTSDLISTYAFQDGWLNGFGIGGGIRWADKAIAGFYGDTTNLNSSGQIAAYNLKSPIYTPATIAYDVWTSYTTKVPRIFGGKVQVRFQFNVRDLSSKGGLIPIAYNMDGSPAYYRIKDPRQFLFTTTFDF